MIQFHNTTTAWRIGTSLVLLAAVATACRAQVAFGDRTLGSQSGSRNPETGNLVVDNCRVFAINDPVLAASREGLLVQVPEPGNQVTAGDVIAKLDDTEATMQLNTAYWSWFAEYQKTKSDVRLRYAKKEAAVSEASYLDGVAANKMSAKAVSEFELRRRKLDAERGVLSIEKTREDMEIEQAAVKVKVAEYFMAKAMRERNYIKTPVTGVVDTISMEIGEWVRPGDPIARVIRIDKLRVKGHVKLANLLPQDVEGRDVIIYVPIGRDASGRTIQESAINSTISFVGVNVEAEEEYLVWADFDNVDDLAVRPGWPARMEIVQ